MSTHVHGFPAFLALAAALAFAPGARAQELVPKHVAAPALDIVSGRVRLPDPAAAATRSRALVVPWTLAENPGGGASARVTVPVDRAGTLSIAVASADGRPVELVARAPDGAVVALDALVASGRARKQSAVQVDEFAGWLAERYDVDEALAGAWELQLARAGSATSGLFVARGASRVAASAHVSTHRTTTDERVAIVARFDEAALAAARGRVTLETTSGSTELELRDDGTSGDGAALDGTFGAYVPSTLRGVVRARVVLDARTLEGHPLARSVDLAFTLLDPRVELAGSATARVADDLRLAIDVGARVLDARSRLHVSSEVWGMGAHGELAPACWLSTMVDPSARMGEQALTLMLDARWLGVAGVRPPLVLRNVRVQDPDTHVVLDAVDELAVELDALPRLAGASDRTVTSDMLMGPITATRTGPQSPTSPVPYLRALMLVHGYCSSGSIWPAADFTQPKLEFLDPNQNRTHDQFAQLLALAGAGYGSFGVLGHSQGGPAALHLYTYYQSPLDAAVGARRIQSVASPYQGTPLASLGGFSCGVNNDMTPSGSAAWLAGIPTWARAEVFYWTTSNSGSACNFFASLILDDPEDGTVERDRGQLPGGNSMGHVVGWCHTTGMSNPASYTDHVRNAERNALAAR